MQGCSLVPILNGKTPADYDYNVRVTAEVVKMAGEFPAYEIRYRFPDETAFQRYQTEFAPALKAEGLALFPPDQLGMTYQRTDGQVILEK